MAVKRWLSALGADSSISAFIVFTALILFALTEHLTKLKEAREWNSILNREVGGLLTWEESETPLPNKALAATQSALGWSGVIYERRQIPPAPLEKSIWLRVRWTAT
jgi:hypothetical protein